MNIGLLIVRLVVGLTLAAHGSQKLFGWFGGGGVSGTAPSMEYLGFRPGRLQAALAGIAEFGGGVFLAAGLLTPAAAAVVVSVMLVAGVSAHGKNGFFLAKGGVEYTLALGAVAAGLAFTGPGALSADQALGVSWPSASGVVCIAFGIAAGALQLLLRRPASVAGVSSETA
jgi:putative oxidoreductase